MSNPRAVRYRRLALVEQDNEKAELLRLVTDEADRGVLFTVEHSVTTRSIFQSSQAARMTKIARMTPTIPRGTVMGERTRGPPFIEAQHFTNAKRAAARLICKGVIPASAFNNK
jgi:hypothetical protein